MDEDGILTVLGVIAVAAYAIILFQGSFLIIPIVGGTMGGFMLLAMLFQTRPIYGILASILVIYLINDFLYG
jgi:hypothetical protein